MTAREFILQDLKNKFGDDVLVLNQHYSGKQWLEKMEEYHQYKLKLLGLHNVIVPLFCDCELPTSNFELEDGTICCCKCEKEIAK